ncbi:MAG TPA: Hsp70 family protein, partial [Candidatus Competibacteraceae bacterium]|nr:Hsp70 family protein [Candidatus Competibacteraceae bacterium]
MTEARYAVGIDLGTTHCVMAAVDLAASDHDRVVERIEAIPQLTAPGAVEERPMLPSFLYLPHPDELRPDDCILPWGMPAPFVVGELARAMGGRTPIRLVSSAKSWLCHPGIDRRAAVLPVEAPDEVNRVSPLQASIHYLAHLRAAWDHWHPAAPLAAQDVVLTVPASFDPAARELTAEAAAAVGLERLVLLEEPQAALYHWILAAGGEWRRQVRLGDIILVIDLGGGTADFSLIAVTERDGTLELVRVAVGDHILLGGDNMDLALAHTVRAKLAQQGINLDPWQLQGLTHACRGAKETLLGDATVAAVPVVVPSRGSRLIGGTLRTELTREEVMATLVDGVFPVVDAARPASRARAALTKLGLPYAQ